VEDILHYYTEASYYTVSRTQYSRLHLTCIIGV